MKKTFYMVMVGVALAIIGAVLAFYFLLKMRNELDAASEEVEVVRRENERLFTLNSNHHAETPEVPEGLEGSSESRT